MATTVNFQLHHMKDVVLYMCDFLPEVVEVGRGKTKAAYGLQLFHNAGRGLSLMYKYLEGWTGNDETEKFREQRRRYNLRKFDLVSYDMIYYAEYIRSLSDLEAAAQSCYRFLRKHNLCSIRTRNTKAKRKLFGVTDNS